MKVLYGSNSGASQEFASQVARAARKAGFQSASTSLDAAVSENLLVPDGRLIVVVTSTYNGLPPDNAVKFKAWLQTQESGSLKGLRFAVFGVGNSQWHTYQQYPREVDAWLHKAGAERVCDLGACDVDGASFESDFDDWLAAMLRVIGGASSPTGDDEDHDDGAFEFVLEEGRPENLTVLRDIRAALQAIMDGKEVAHKLLGIKDKLQQNTFPLEVVKESRELCQNADGRSVRHVTLRLPSSHAGYRAGDHLEVFPPNDLALVTGALDALGVNPDAIVRWDPSKTTRKWRNTNSGTDEILSQKMPIMYITARLVAEWVPDLAAAPARKVCTRLARYAATPDAKQELLALGTDATLYKETVSSPGLSLTELLQRFKGKMKLTLGELVMIAKNLQPRRYSVSSSPEAMTNKNEVTVSVGQLEFVTGTGRVHHGLASTRLGTMPKGAFIPGTVRTMQSGFRLPDDHSAPVIMVGPGTGIAPMMGFLQERESLLKKRVKLGPAVMFFGCRSSTQDYLYKEELAAHLKSGALSNLQCAFSRETAQKVYVQDKIWEDRDAVWKLLEDPRCMVYICGDARSMAPDVKRAFQKVAEHCGGKSTSSAANMVAAMVEGNRYLEDVWAA